MKTTLRCKVCSAIAVVSVDHGRMNKEVTWSEGKSPGRKGYQHTNMMSCPLHSGLTLEQLLKHQDVEKVR